MIYHLDTIPVWEAMEKETPCPFCALYERMEQQEVERSLGGSVMEPDTRIRVNETGICARHHQQLFGMQNRLGHALLTDSHSKELLKKLEKLEKQAENLPKRGLFSKRTEEDELAAALRALSSGCVICEGIDSHMKRSIPSCISGKQTQPLSKNGKLPMDCVSPTPPTFWKWPVRA